MQNKKNVWKVIIGLVIAVVIFYGGVQYGSSKSSASQAGVRSQGNFAQNGGARGGQGMRGGGFVSGTVLSKDATSLVVQIKSNGGADTTGQTGSKIVLFSPSTKVEKTVSGLPADVIVGKQVTIIGTTNPDGSVSATSIQIRPDMAPNQTVNPKTN